MHKTWILLLALAAAACSGGTTPVGGGTLQGTPQAETEVIVQLADPDDADEIDDLLDDYQGLHIERIGRTSFFVLQVAAGTDLDALLDDLGNDLRVMQSSPNYLGELPEGGPGDLPTLGSDLLGAIAVQPGLDLLDLAAAQVVTRGAGVVVGVVDTGVDVTHPYLMANLEPNGFDFIDGDPDPNETRDFVDNDEDGLVDEQFGHGTFVASLVLAVAPDARILPVRALNDDGIGTTSTVAAGIIWAVDNGAHIVNVSVDIPSASEPVREAIHYAEAREVVVVAAGGNSGDNQVIFPARFSDVIGVAAVDGTGVVPDFSNVGSMVNLVAPGVDLIGAYPMTESPDGTAHWSGTSFSAPLVAGSAALVIAVSPGLQADEVIRRLEDTAMSVDALNPMFAGRLGDGLVQPAAAVIP
ncbi:MAG: S8 family peptidase [Planctomycetota bacterium]|jgi:subtilisin family serine protease